MLQSPGGRTDNRALARSFQGALMPKSIVAGALVSSYFFLINSVSIPCKLLMRKNMGERAFSPLALFLALFGLLFLGYWAFLLFDHTQYGDFLGLSKPIGKDSWLHFFEFLFLYLVNPLTFFFFLILGEGINHFKQVIQKIKAKEYSYSYLRGENIYFQKLKGKIFGVELNEANRRMILEPFAGLIISSSFFILGAVLMSNRFFEPINIPAIRFIDAFLIGFTTVSLAMMISSFCLFLEELGIAMRFRSELLDVLDGEIYARQITEARKTTKYKIHPSIESEQDEVISE